MQSSATSSETSARRRAVLSRYYTIAFALMAAIVVLQLVLHAIWSLLDNFPLQQRSPQREVWIVVVSYLICKLLVEPIQLRQYRFRDLIRYPPIWAPVLVGLLIVCVLDQWFPNSLLIELYSPDQQYTSSPTWLILTAMITAVIIRGVQMYKQSGATLPNQIMEHTSQIPESRRWINSREDPIKKTSEDLFSRAGSAGRIVEHIRNNERTIALLGPMGSGKTSILNIALQSLRTCCPNTLIIRSDLWKARSPEQVPEIILNDTVKMLDDICDTVDLRGIPLTYKRLIAATPSSALHRLFSLDRRSNTLHGLDKLDTCLEALDRHIVLVIEDIERLPDSFGMTHVSRFLWSIREIHRCSAIIASDPKHTKMDFAKLCDSIEHVPDLLLMDIAKILTEQYEHWTSNNGDINPQINHSGRDKLELEMVMKHSIPLYLLDQVHSTPIRMLTTLLRTPRLAKQTLHRIDFDWNELHGEVNLDDLIILSVLRSCAPSTFQFIVTNIEVARKTSDGLEDGLLKSFCQEWEKVLQRERHSKAVSRLVDLLGIPQLRAPKAPALQADQSPQGVHTDEKPDYFARIVAGKISPNEIRDQDVLRDIAESKLGNCRKVAEGLVQSARSDDSYASVWYRFSKPSVDESLKTTDDVIDILLEQHGAAVDPKHPALVMLSSRLHKELPVDGLPSIQHWLECQASRNVAKSLSLASGLVLFCDRALPKLEGSRDLARLSRLLLDEISRQVESPHQLCESLSVDYPCTVRILLSDVRSESDAHGIQLMFQLLEAAETDRQQIIPQLAYSLVVQGPPRPEFADDGTVRGILESKINLERLKILFRSRESDVLRLLSEYSGSDELCIRVKDAARGHLESDDWRKTDSDLPE